MRDRGEDPSVSGGIDASPGAASARAALATVALCGLLLAACASAYGDFRPEAEIPSCAAWLREAEGVPCRVVRHVAGDAGGRPYRIEIEARGSGRSDRVLVLVHGVLSDRRTWRFMVGRLAADHDVLLVDLPGCGGSDRPDPRDIGPRGYDPDTVAAALLEALRAELRTRDAPAAITLVGHSYGSAVVLRALGDPALRRRYPEVLDRVDGAVLFSTPDWSYAKRDPAFERVATVGGLAVLIGNVLGLVRNGIAESVRNGVENPASTPREEIDRMWEILTDPARRAAAQSMLRRVVPFTADLVPDWRRIEALESENRRVPVPCLLVCGGRDDAVPGALSFKLAAQLPDARLRVIPRAGHSLPTERPEECADLVLAFAAERGAGWRAYEEYRRPAPEGAASLSPQ